ncbi:MAG: ATP-dependent helicase [Christensenellales bacterium]|jgi:DNA helicase-2/ATP-dependent DNA helicase PcrA
MDLGGLNKMQRLAVEHGDGPLLILAGAGSGKTRVLTYRIARLIEEGVPPWQILALTFTNKAAAEMKERIAALTGSGRGVWASTFHSFCVRILQRDIEKLGYEKNFSIYDDSDQMSVIKECLKELGLSEDYYEPRDIKSRISDAKNKFQTPDEWALDNSFNPIADEVRSVFERYSQKLKASNALDFDDLLVCGLRLLREHEDIAQKYAGQFRYILVDEYQDTNHTQYMMVKLLAKGHGNICVVGDDDQSIYGWRGANIRNILDFEKDFPSAKVIRLEQNYRSSGNILSAANCVICNNTGRKQKKLWTDSGSGEKIGVIKASDERAEAVFICEIIDYLMNNEGRALEDFAILYRMNAQSRVIEETLMRYGIPYSVYGGMKFYDRREIKDIVAYMRCCVNPADEISLRRIINVPRRGIGNTTISELTRLSEQRGEPLFATILSYEELPLKTAAKRSVGKFAELMSELIPLAATQPPSEFVSRLIDATAFLEQYQNSEENRMKAENVKEFLGAVSEFEQAAGEEASLGDYLDNIALISDIDSMEGKKGVSLMTLHSAKGLEFPVVFIAGMEENIFPSSRSLHDEDKLEEERRLCYVGITRAEQRIFLSYAALRMLFGSTMYNLPSRFLAEIDDSLIEVAAASKSVVTSASAPRTRQESWGSVHRPPAVQPKKVSAGSFKVSSKVMHDKFGEGTVIAVSGNGDNMMVSVAFGGQGIKKLMAAYAPMKIIG